MELVLTQADLDGMPAELRDWLLRYLGRSAAPEQRETAQSAPLTREDLVALLREVDFHRSGARLHLLLDRLAYTDAARPPSRERMAEALADDAAHLGRYMAMLNRLVAKVTGHRGARLCEYHKADGTYVVPAATRAMLRELLTTMRASGKSEEPLWE